MGILGNVTSYIDFKDPVNSAPLNQRFINRFPVGIYYGADLSIISNTSVSVSAFDIEITDGTYLMKATSSGLNTVTVSTSNVYVYFTWSYTGVSNDVPTLAAGSSVPANAVVVGQCVYSGPTLQGFNLANRTDAPVYTKFGAVEPTNPASLSVKIRAGNACTYTQTYFISEQTIALSTAGLTAGQSVISVVAVTPVGAATVIAGTPATTGSQTVPSYAGNLPLAQVTLTYGQTAIIPANILDVRPFLAYGQNLSYLAPTTLVIPTTTSDPGSPVNGQIWLRTDF